MDKELIPGIIIGKLMNIGGMLQRQGNQMLQPFNLNHQQFAVFFEIAKVGRVKQKEMVNRLMLEKAHVSKVVKKLHKMGLITVSKTDADKRACWLATTPQGEETLAQCTQMFREWHREWVGEIDEAEFTPLLESLTKLQSIFKDKTR